MELKKAIFERRSIRQFKPKLVERSKLIEIIKAGLQAPSSDNLQPYRFIVILNKKAIEKIFSFAPWGQFAANAPSAVAIVIEKDNKWAETDAALLTENMLLRAWELGIGSCFVGEINKESVGKFLGLRENEEIFTVLPFGYGEYTSELWPVKKKVENCVEFVE